MTSTPPNSPALFPICESGLWGFIDTCGEVVIEPQFAYAYEFSEGLARVDLVGRPEGREQGFIDRSGDLVIPPGPPRGVEPTCSETQDFSWSFGDFSEGLASLWVNDAGGFGGYIDRSGKVVVQPRFKEVCDFGEGLAFVTLPDPEDPEGLAGKQSAFVSPTGKLLLHPRALDSTRRLRDGRCVVSVSDYDEDTDQEDHAYGYVDRQGAVVIPTTYLCADDFGEGFACVRQTVRDGGCFGFVGRRGETVIPFELSQCSRVFGADQVVYAVRRQEPLLLDSRGQVVATVELDPAAFVGDYADGLASGSLEVDGAERCGYLDIEGRLALPLEYDEAGDFRAGLAFVRTGERTGYVARSGAFVWSTESWDD